MLNVVKSHWWMFLLVFVGGIVVDKLSGGKISELLRKIPVLGEKL